MPSINPEYYSKLAQKYVGKYGRGKRELEDWKKSEVKISEYDLEGLAHGLEYACLQIQEQTDYIKNLQEKLANPDSIESMTKALELHHKSVVRPVKEYCQAFYDWIDACAIAADEYDKLAGETKAWRSPPPLYQIRDYLSLLVHLDIGKSDYLRRRIYGKEPHRTKKCPVHDGHWSGIRFSEERVEGCLCQDPGGNVSGWILPEE